MEKFPIHFCLVYLYTDQVIISMPLPMYLSQQLLHLAIIPNKRVMCINYQDNLPQHSLVEQWQRVYNQCNPQYPEPHTDCKI
jgi:hypothetical protein